jgi:hypothetical protein
MRNSLAAVTWFWLEVCEERIYAEQQHDKP